MKKEIVSENAPAAIGPYSQGIEANGFVYVSGQLPIDPISGKFPDGGVGALTKQSLDNISAILYEAGLTMRDVVKTTVFLTNMNDFTEMNEAYASYFEDETPLRSLTATFWHITVFSHPRTPSYIRPHLPPDRMRRSPHIL